MIRSGKVIVWLWYVVLLCVEIVGWLLCYIFMMYCDVM